MRSQSLFNFFTKSAVNVYTGAEAQEYGRKMQAAGDAAAKAEQKRRSKMTDEQRWGEDLDYHLNSYGNPQYGGSVRHAYSNYSDTMKKRYGNGQMTKDQYDASIAYARNRLATDQFNKMWESYQSYTSPELHPNDATSPSRMNSRMISDTERANYIFNPKAKGWNPTNMTYAQFRDNFIDPKTGQLMSKEEALEKWNSMWQSSVGQSKGNSGVAANVSAPSGGSVPASGSVPAGPSKGNSGVPAGGSAPSSGSPQDESWRSRGYQQRYAAEDAYANNKAEVNAANKDNPSTTLTFKGGHIVNYDPRYVKDWSRATDTTNNNVGGTWYTDEQYLAYEDISKQLRQSMTGSGMDPTKARAEASRLAKAYINDQMSIAAANGDASVAKNRWMEQPPAKQPVETTSPAPTVTNNPNPVTPHSANLNVEAPHIDFNNGKAVGYQESPNTTLSFNTTDNVQVPSTLTPAMDGQSVLTLDGIGLGSNGENSLYNTMNFTSGGSPNLAPGGSTAPAPAANTDNTVPPAVTPTLQGKGQTLVNPNAAPALPQSDGYELGFAHTSADAFNNKHKNATYAQTLQHYGDHAWNNMQNLKAKITELRNNGLGNSEECQRLEDQFRLSRQRYTSIQYALNDDMDEDELNGTYMPGKFDWIFDAADSGSEYWRQAHKSWLQSEGRGYTSHDFADAMPGDLARFK